MYVFFFCLNNSAQALCNKLRYAESTLIFLKNESIVHPQWIPFITVSLFFIPWEWEAKNIFTDPNLNWHIEILFFPDYHPFHAIGQMPQTNEPLPRI